MTDLEICKCIAEIEGVHAFGSGDFIMHKPNGWPEIYNPLTGDALNHRLMIKYDLDLMSPYRKNNETKWEAQVFVNNYADTISVYDENPNRAICLAIIEAHKVQL